MKAEEAAYKRLKQAVVAHTGHHYYDDKDALLRKRLDERAREVGAPNLAGYETVANALTWTWYLLSSAPDSLRDLRAHARSIGVVYPTYFQCAVPSGRVLGADAPTVTDYAHEQHIAVMPRFNCQDGATVHAILTESTLRAATLGEKSFALVTSFS